MKHIPRLAAAAAIIASAGLVSVAPAQAVEPGAVHVTFPTRSWSISSIPSSIEALIARILKEECQVFPFLCQLVTPPVIPPITVLPPTTVTTLPVTATATTVPVITVPVVTVPVPTPVPLTSSNASTATSSCTVTVMGGGVAQCSTNISVSSG